MSRKTHFWNVILQLWAFKKSKDFEKECGYRLFNCERCHLESSIKQKEKPNNPKESFNNSLLKEYAQLK